MAKLKSKINSKYKAAPKRKLANGGLEDSPYVTNTVYQAQDAPTTMLQNQFDANEQRKAQQMTAIYGNQMTRQMDYLQDQNTASEQRKKEEETARQQQAEANKQSVNQQVTQTAGKAGKQITKDAKAGLFNTVTPVASNYYSPTWAPITPAPVAPVGPAPVMINPAMQTATSTTGDLFAGAPTVGQNLATTSTTSSFGQTAAAVGKSVGGAALVAAPAIVGQIAYNQLNKADDRQIKREGKSQYFDDTNYSRKEFNAQMLKSTGKGATIGGTIGSAIPIPGVGTGLGMAIGAAVGAGVGAIKATHQRRMTKDESERGVKIGNKRFGKKLLFGEENAYDENLDPTVIEKRNREAQLKAMTDTANAMENARMGSMTQSDLNTGFALKNSTFEAKYGGNIKYLKGGVAKSIGRGAVEYVGKKHEYGGIDLPGNIEVEGGETEQNNYIFSATLKLPNGKTYAQAHKNLLKSGASGEEIHQLALSQEAAAGRNPNEIKGIKFAKYGGPIQYKKGGKKEPDIVVGGRSKEYWENLTVDCAQNPNQSGCYKKPKDFATSWLDNTQRFYNGDLANEAINSNLSYDDFLKRFNIKSSRAMSSKARGRNTIKAQEDEIKGNIESINKELNNPNISEEDKKSYKQDLENQKIQLQNLDKGLLPVPSREEYEFYRGQRNNPNTTIPNPANGTTIPNAELFNKDPFGKPVIGATQGEEGRQASEYGPILRGRNITALPRQQAQLAQYNLPNITVNNTSTFVPDEEPIVQNQITSAIANSGLSTEEFAKQTGVDPELIKGIQTGAVNLNVDEQTMLMAAIPTTQTQTNNNPPVNTNITVSNTTDNKPTINNANTKFQYTATGKGNLDYTERDKAGNEIWAGDRYEKEWKPLVSTTMGDAANADKVISYLENYSGQDAADVKAKLAGKTREQKIAAINRLATDKMVGPFHNAVLEGINTTKETPPPVEPVVEKKKDEETPPPVKKDYTMELPPPPTYTRTKSTNGLGLIQTIPAAAALTNNIKTKDINPALISSYVQPGAIGRVNIGRVSYNAERAANQANQVAVNQALQNMSGPGAVAGMMAAKTKADQQALQIGQAEQNTNMERAAREAGINTGISQFNVGQTMAAQQANANIDQANAGRIQQAAQFNRQLGYARDVENREQRLGALDRGAQAITMNALANRQIDATENLANVQDYSNSYKRYLETIAPTLGITTTTTEDKTKTKVKFGGVKKYVSRLGDLKNNRTFKA